MAMGFIISHTQQVVLKHVAKDAPETSIYFCEKRK
jgi:hypothetical protein